ncbi:MAG: tyrosine-type recombinase/integrase [Chloroflexota bacterium]
MNSNNNVTIKYAVDNFIKLVEQSRSLNTALSYKKGLNLFMEVLKKNHIEVDKNDISVVNEDTLPRFLEELKTFSPASEQLYISAVNRFFNYLSAEKLSEINLPRMKEIVRMRSRKIGHRLPQFPRSEIESLIQSIISMTIAVEDPERLRDLRDRAFIVVLSDTGLRVHEACNLRRGDIDWNEGRAVIIGKGNKQAVIRFSIRSMELLREYLRIRSTMDGKSGKTLASLPLFSRHDKGAGSKIKPITPTTGRNIIVERVKQFLGEESQGKITPHSFRHYFVTTVLRASGNLKLAQELARHSNISVTQRYAHLSDDELDKGYFDIFDNKK